MLQQSPKTNNKLHFNSLTTKTIINSTVQQRPVQLSLELHSTVQQALAQYGTEAVNTTWYGNR